MNQNVASAGSGIILMIAGLLAGFMPEYAVKILAYGTALSGVVHAVKPLLPPKLQDIDDKL